MCNSGLPLGYVQSEVPTASRALSPSTLLLSFFLPPPSSLHTLSSLYLPPFLLPPPSLQCDEPGCEAAFKKHSKLALHKTRHLDDPKPFKLVTNFSKDTSLHGSSLHAYLCTHKHKHTQVYTRGLLFSV